MGAGVNHTPWESNGGFEAPFMNKSITASLIYWYTGKAMFREKLSYTLSAGKLIF